MNNELFLNTLIYPRKSIFKSICDYQSVCKIKIICVSDIYVQCVFECNDQLFLQIKDEFCNYLIAQSNKRESHD